MPSTDSDPEEGTLHIDGVWLHDPLDAEGTATGFPYGDESSRGQARTTQQAGIFYAGRQLPVYDYGENQTNMISVRFTLLRADDGWDRPAELDTLVDFAEARRTLYYRDNRGRAMYAAASDYQEADTAVGTEVSLSFTEVDYDESA